MPSLTEACEGQHRYVHHPGPAFLILVQQQSAAAVFYESSHCPSFLSASRVAAEGISV
jgi:hypothetical protein